MISSVLILSFTTRVYACINPLQSTIASLKEEGSRAFAMKEYDRAVAAWDKALALEDISKSDVALIHNNKAACHMVSKNYKDAVSECSVALETQPEYFKAFIRRSKAYEAMGMYKEALADLQKANGLDAATDDSRAAEKRVRDLAAGKKPAGMGNGLARRSGASAARAATSGTSGRGNSLVMRGVPVKLTFGDDIRQFNLVPGVKYSELLEYVRSLFPKAGHFVLKYLDKQGDLVTIASKQDLHVAMSEAIDAAGKGAARGAGSIPPVRLHAISVESAEDVPKIPEDELQQQQQYMKELFEHLQRQQAAKDAQANAATEQQPPQVQVDEWLLSFVEMLKEYCHLDVDRPLEAQEIGQDRLNAAFHSMMQNDPKSEELLDQAHDKFKEQASLAMLCQAQVHEAKATRLMFKAAADSTPATQIAADVEKHLAAAEAKAKEALAYCPDIPDGFLTLNNIHMARAKLAADYLIEAVPPKEDIKDPVEKQEAEEAAARAAAKKAADRVTAKSAAAADAHMERAYAELDNGMKALPAEERDRELKPLKPMAEQVPGDPESETPLKASMLINAGNARYEHSILRAAGGLEWRPLIEEAAKLFREAGAAEIDIRNALKGHPMSEEMADLIGPEPDTAQEDNKKTEEPKGVAALPKKK